LTKGSVKKTRSSLFDCSENYYKVFLLSKLLEQEQYVFIHLAILESLTCGNTEIQASNLQTAMNKLTTMNPQKNVTGYALEFEVGI
jgi:hypothetical protein